MITNKKIIDAIMVLNSSAKVIVHSHNDDLDTAKIIWLDNTPVISNADIKAQMEKMYHGICNNRKFSINRINRSYK